MEAIETDDLTELICKGNCIAFFEALQDSDAAKIMELATNSAGVWLYPLGTKGPFKDFENKLNKLTECFSGLGNELDSVWVDNNFVICKLLIYGTQRQDFFGLVSKGLNFQDEFVFIFRFNDEQKIVALTVDWNHESLVQQLAGSQSL